MTKPFSITQIKADDVIILKIHSNDDPDELEYICKEFRARFPENKVIGLVDSVELESYELDQAIKYLENFIAELKEAKNNG